MLNGEDQRRVKRSRSKEQAGAAPSALAVPVMMAAAMQTSCSERPVDGARKEGGRGKWPLLLPIGFVPQPQPEGGRRVGVHACIAYYFKAEGTWVG